jgi:hypothetical protein
MLLLHRKLRLIIYMIQTLLSYHIVLAVYPLPLFLRIGKGFAGVMKRWNFAGLPASHGVSLAHRSAGSTGQRKVCFPLKF